jgi:hypothetical protein
LGEVADTSDSDQDGDALPGVAPDAAAPPDGSGPGAAAPPAACSARHAPAVRVAGFTVRPSRGVVPAHGRAIVRVEFAPRVAGPVEVPLAVVFTPAASTAGAAARPPSGAAPAAAEGGEAAAPPPAKLVLRAVARELPVSAEREVVDFK